MTESPDFIERPEDLSVSHAEGQGMWAQIDAARIGIHNVMASQARTERVLLQALLLLRVLLLLVSLPCLITAVIGALVLLTHVAQFLEQPAIAAIAAMVGP